MHFRRLLVVACIAVSPLLILQIAPAQDVMKILTGSEFPPEQQRTMLERHEFKTLTPEEIERGNAELEEREKESRLEELERIEKEKKEEKEAKRREEISQQERELRYILNKYKDRIFRNIQVLIRSFIKDQFIKENIDIQLENVRKEDIDRLDLISFELA